VELKRAGRRRGREFELGESKKVRVKGKERPRESERERAGPKQRLCLVDVCEGILTQMLQGNTATGEGQEQRREERGDARAKEKESESQQASECMCVGCMSMFACTKNSETYGKLASVADCSERERKGGRAIESECARVCVCVCTLRER